MQSKPKADGFAMPAEWAPHEKSWILWPYRQDNWRLEAKPAQEAFVNVIKAIASCEPISVGVIPSEIERAREALAGVDQVDIVEMDSDDSWIRDTGPTFLLNGNKTERRGVDWKFNAWGEVGKVDGINYVTWEKDSLIASKVLQLENSARYEADFILEGGSIHVDGEGTVLTTEECLLNPNRNPHLSKQEIEDRLKEYLNVEKVIWLPLGLTADEDTNGHIDNFCCFYDVTKVLLAWCDDPSDPQYAISREAYDILSTTTDAKGRSLTITKIPIPPPMHYTEEECQNRTLWGGHNPRTPGERLAASYVNFYITNGGIVCPRFDAPTDSVAAEILQSCFPDRRILQVPGREILLGGGNIHCITQQQPAVNK